MHMTNDDRRRLREGIKRGSDMLAICTSMLDRGVMTEDEYRECLRIIGGKRQQSEPAQMELF
jgi:hypothetical protein